MHISRPQRASLLTIPPAPSRQQTPLRLRCPWAAFSRSLLLRGDRPPVAGLASCAAFAADPQERRRLLTIRGYVNQ